MNIASSSKQLLKFILVSVTLLILQVGGSWAANHYKADILQKMAVASGLKTEIENMAEGIHYAALHYKNRPVTIVVEGGKVCHIGYSLFTLSQRQAFGEMLTNFIERYWLALDLPLKRDKDIHTQMYEDGVTINPGSLYCLRQIFSDTTLTVTFDMKMEKQYMVKWERDSNTVCSITFPANHELLMERNMLENDRRLSGEICAMRIVPTHQPVEESQLLKSKTAPYSILKQGSYYFEDFTADRYFVKKGKQYQVLFDMKYKRESIANMLTGTDIEIADSIALTLRQQTYNYSQCEIRTTLRKFVAYCISEGCKAYVGFISDNGETCDVELIMRNASMGYNHVMRLTINYAGLAEGKAVATGRLNAFVPTSNLKNLFNDEIKN